VHRPLKGRVRRVDLQAQARASELGFNFFSFKIVDDLLSDPIFFEKKKQMTHRLLRYTICSLPA